MTPDLILSRSIDDRRNDRTRIIRLHPSRVFGNGDHETTRSCLALLERMDFSGARILDLGSGNGILSIAAAYLGGGQIVAVDNSFEAAAACRANVRLNGFGHIIHVVSGTIAGLIAAAFDLIMANIHGDVLISLAPQIAGRLRPGGHCILSGILYEDHYEVRTSFSSSGCTPQKAIFMDEYTTLHLIKDENVRTSR